MTNCKLNKMIEKRELDSKTFRELLNPQVQAYFTEQDELNPPILGKHAFSYHPQDQIAMASLYTTQPILLEDLLRDGEKILTLDYKEPSMCAISRDNAEIFPLLYQSDPLNAFVRVFGSDLRTHQDRDQFAQTVNEIYFELKGKNLLSDYTP